MLAYTKRVVYIMQGNFVDSCFLLISAVYVKIASLRRARDGLKGSGGYDYRGGIS
jgi:hypothetical protein